LKPLPKLTAIIVKTMQPAWRRSVAWSTVGLPIAIVSAVPKVLAMWGYLPVILILNIN
jgi:hypothetical protein